MDTCATEGLEGNSAQRFNLCFKKQICMRYLGRLLEVEWYSSLYGAEARRMLLDLA